MGGSQSRIPPARGGTPKNSGARSAGKQRPNPSTSSDQAQEPASGGVGATLSGWWGGATSWMGEKYDQVSGAVSSGWNSVKKTAGDFRDIYKNTDLGWEDGKISASTDADEVLDVLPADLRKQLNLDKSDPAANKVNLEMDTNTGVLTLKIPNLQLNSLAMGGLTAGKTSMTGLVATLSNADGMARSVVEKKAGSRVAGWVFGKDRQVEGAKSLDSNTALRIGRVQATDVALADSGVSAAGVDLMGLAVSIQNKGGGLPGLDATPDRLAANFSVASAVVRGLKTPDTAATELSASGVGLNIDQDSESGSLSARRLGASGLSIGGEHLGSGEVEGLKGNFSNRGGGLPMLDKKPDQLALASASMDRAKVSGYAGKEAGLASGELRNVAYGERDGRRTMTVGGVDIEKLRTAKFSAAKLHGTRLGGHADSQSGQAGLSVGELSAAGVDAGGQKLAGANIQGLDAQVSGKGGVVGMGGTFAGTRGSVASASVSGLDTDQIDLSSAAVQGGSWSHNGSGSSAQAAGVQVAGVTGDKLRVDQASATNLATRRDAGGSAASASRVSGRGLEYDSTRLGSLEGQELSTEIGAAGSTSRAAQLSAGGIATPWYSADSTSLSGLNVKTGASGVDVGANRLSASNARSGEVSTDRLSGADIAVGVGGGGTTVRAGELGAAGLGFRDNRVGQLDLAGANVGVSSKDGRATTGEIRQISASGIDTASLDVGSASVSNSAWQTSSAGMSGSVGELDVAGVSGVMSADRLTASGARGSHGQSGTTAGVDRLTGTRLAHGNNQVGGLSASGLGYQQGAEGIAAQVGEAKVSGVDTASIDAAAASVKGLDVRHGPAGSHARLGRGSVDGLSGKDLQVGTAAVDSLSGSLAAGGESGRLQVGGANVTSARMGDNRVAGANLSGLDVTMQNTGGGLPFMDSKPDKLALDASLTGASATGVDTRMADAATVNASGLRVRSGGGNTQVGASQVGASDIRVDAGAHQLQAGSAKLSNAQAQLGAQTSATVGQTGISDLRFSSQLAGAGMGPAKPVARGAEGDMADMANLSGINAQGNVSLKSGKVGLGASSPGQYADLVQDLDATARIPLRQGDYGSIEVDKGTHVDAKAQVRGGNVVPQNTRADVNNPLDAPLWVTARGGYLEGDKKRPDQMKLRADLGGAPDLNISDKLPGGRDRLPTDLGDLVSQVAPAQTGQPSQSAGSATLAREHQNDNNIGFSAKGADNLVMTFTRLLVSSLNVNAGGTQVQAGRSAASGASVQVDAGGADAKVTGSIGKIDVQDLNVGAGGTKR